MSRSNAPKQATLNQWVNYEAVKHYAAGLARNAGQIEGYQWPDEPTPKQAAAIEAVKAASAALDQALTLARTAEQLATEVSYDWLYNRS